jgi:hypothetical protein
LKAKEFCKLKSFRFAVLGRRKMCSFNKYFWGRNGEEIQIRNQGGVDHGTSEATFSSMIDFSFSP